MFTPILAIFGIGGQELLIVAFIAMLLFGSRIPQVMGGLGKGIRDFKKGLNAPDDEDESDPNFAKPPKSKD